MTSRAAPMTAAVVVTYVTVLVVCVPWVVAALDNVELPAIHLNSSTTGEQTLLFDVQAVYEEFVPEGLHLEDITVDGGAIPDWILMENSLTPESVTPFESDSSMILGCWETDTTPKRRFAITYGSSESSVHIWDWTNASAVHLVHTEYNGVVSFSSTYSVAVVDSAYVCGGQYNGVWMLDASDPDNITAVGDDLPENASPQSRHAVSGDGFLFTGGSWSSQSAERLNVMVVNSTDANSYTLPTVDLVFSSPLFVSKLAYHSRTLFVKHVSGDLVGYDVDDYGQLSAAWTWESAPSCDYMLVLDERFFLCNTNIYDYNERTVWTSISGVPLTDGALQGRFALLVGGHYYNDPDEVFLLHIDRQGNPTQVGYSIVLKDTGYYGSVGNQYPHVCSLGSKFTTTHSDGLPNFILSTYNLHAMTVSASPTCSTPAGMYEVTLLFANSTDAINVTLSVTVNPHPPCEESAASTASPASSAARSTGGFVLSETFWYEDGTESSSAFLSTSTISSSASELSPKSLVVVGLLASVLIFAPLF